MVINIVDFCRVLVKYACIMLSDTPKFEGL